MQQASSQTNEDQGSKAKKRSSLFGEWMLKLNDFLFLDSVQQNAQNFSAAFDPNY